MSAENKKLIEAARAGVFGDDVEILGRKLLPKGTWLVHFSDEAEAIASEGFTRGSPLDGKLAYTSGARGRGEPGYNFAFLADDEYALMLVSGFDFGGSQREAVVFRSEALHMRHYDGFEQACFWGPSAEWPIVRIRCASDPEDEDGLEPHERPWDVLDRDGEVMCSNEGLFGALDAAIQASESYEAAPKASAA